MIYLDLADLLQIADRVIGGAEVRDLGLLSSAAARPQASFAGVRAYSTLEEQAAALFQSVALNHALVDGNKRLALAALISFLGINGRRLTMTNDEAYDFVIAAITEHTDIPALAQQILNASEDWS